MVKPDRHYGPVRKERTPQSEIERLEDKIEEYEQQLITMRLNNEKSSAIDRLIRRIRTYTDELNGWKEIQ